VLFCLICKYQNILYFWRYPCKDKFDLMFGTLLYIVAKISKLLDLKYKSINDLMFVLKTPKSIVHVKYMLSEL